VTLTGPVSDLFSVAYLGSFDPTNLCGNYLADSGDSTASSPTPRSYSFNVASNATFIVIVNEVNTGDGGPYALDVTGGDCRPRLNIAQAPAGKVVVDWTTASAGYLLESTNIVSALSPWPPVTNVPVVVNGRFHVTNNVTGTNLFYHLHKP